MKTIYNFLILFLVGGCFLSAQEDVMSDKMMMEKDSVMTPVNRRQIKMSFDIHEARLNELNSELRKAGISPVGDYGYRLGLALPIFLNSESKGIYFEVALNAYYREHNNVQQIPKVASITGAGSEVDLVFPIVKTKFLEIEPFLGLSLDYYSINVSDRLGSNKLADIPANYNTYKIENFTVSGVGGLQLGIRLPVLSGITIGARGGMFATAPTNWNLNNTRVLDDTIDLNSLFAGAYFKINL